MVKLIFEVFGDVLFIEFMVLFVLFYVAVFKVKVLVCLFVFEVKCSLLIVCVKQGLPRDARRHVSPPGGL